MTIDPNSAEMIAIKGLQFLAGDEEHLNRFLALSGMDASQLRENASSPAFLAAILEYFMGNEPTLLAFCASQSINPRDIATAHQSLAGEPGAGPGDFLP